MYTIGPSSEQFCGIFICVYLKKIRVTATTEKMVDGRQQ